MTNAVIFLSRTVSAQQFLWELYFVWGQLGNFVFGNSSRQILSLHSVSVTSSSLRLLPGCRCNSLPPIFHQDRCSSSCLNLWSITLHPSSLTLKGIIIIQETFLEFHHNHPTHPLPPSSSSLGLWQKPPEVFGASKSPLLKTVSLCAICYHRLQYPQTGSLPAYWAFVLILLHPGNGRQGLMDHIDFYWQRMGKPMIILNYFNLCNIQLSEAVDGNRVWNFFKA